MRSILTGAAVLAGSAVLGLGLYSVVIQQPQAKTGTAATAVSLRPSPTPTVYKYRTKIVKVPVNIDGTVADPPAWASAHFDFGSQLWAAGSSVTYGTSDVANTPSGTVAGDHGGADD